MTHPKLLISIFISFFLLLATSSPLYAQNTVPIGGPIEGIGFLGTGLNNINTASFVFAKLLSTTVGLFTVGAGVWFMLQVILGSITWISAAADKNQLSTAQKRIQNALIGLILVLSSLLIAALVETIFDIQITSIDFNRII